MRLFINHQPGSLCLGLFPLIAWSMDWRDAEDGITLIRPRLRRIKYSRGL